MPQVANFGAPMALPARVLSDFVKRHTPDDFEMPPASLPSAVARDICRLRAGLWWRLGFQTIFHRTGDIPCKLCGLLLSRERGSAVAHLFDCPLRPNHPPATNLFSNDAGILTVTHKYCMEFSVLVTDRELAVAEEQDEEDGATEE